MLNNEKNIEIQMYESINMIGDVNPTGKGIACIEIIKAPESA